MYIVQRKQRRDADAPGHGWNERCHPVIAVDDGWPHVRYDVIDDFTLEDQGAAHVVVRVSAVDMITIIEYAVLC